MNQLKSPPRTATGNGQTNTADLHYSESPADRLLSRLDKVAETGSGQWVCRCPSHDDRSPSLSIKETSDGTLLVKCFAGCETGDVLAAVGLEMKDLFPRSLSHHRAPKSKSQRRRYGQALEALRAIQHEACIIHCAAGVLADGESLSEDDFTRLRQAESAIKNALEVVS